MRARVLADTGREALVFVADRTGVEVRVRYTRRANAMREWRCDHCPTARACRHITAAKNALIERTSQ